MKKRFWLFFMLFIFSTNYLRSSEIEDIENGLFLDEYIEEEAFEEVEDELRIEQELMIISSDPIKMIDTYSRRVITLMYDTLFVVDNNKNIVPKLAEEYEWIDNNKLYIKLKEGKKFHDGTSLTSQDVVFTFNRIKNEETIAHLYESILGIEVINDLEFIIKLNSKDNMLLELLANPTTSIVKLMEDGRPHGTGPYCVEEFGEGELTLIRYDEYSSTIKDYYKNIKIKWEGNASQRLVNFVNGNADYVFDLYKEDIDKTIEYGLLDENSTIGETYIYDTIALTFGQQHEYSFEERVAIKSSLRQDVNTFFPEELVKAELSKVSKNYNAEEAKENIKKAGLKNKEVDIMVLNIIHNMVVAERVKEDLERAGMKVNLLPHNMVSFYQKLYKKDYDLAIYNITLSRLSPVMSLDKVLTYDLKDEEMIGALQPFMMLMKKEKTNKSTTRIFDKVLSLLDKNVLYIPLEHKLNNYVANEEDRKKFDELIGFSDEGEK